MISKQLALKCTKCDALRGVAHWQDLHFRFGKRPSPHIMPTLSNPRLQASQAPMICAFAEQIGQETWEDRLISVMTSLLTANSFKEQNWQRDVISFLAAAGATAAAACMTAAGRTPSTNWHCLTRQHCFSSYPHLSSVHMTKTSSAVGRSEGSTCETKY